MNNGKVKRLRLLVIAAVLSYFFAFTGSGLRAGFTHDDLMNLCLAWQAPMWRHVRDVLLFWTPSATYRPGGALLYASVIHVFGFTPLPFRCCCYALLIGNLALAYSVVRRIAGSGRVAVLSVLLLAYHGNYWPIYTNTGLCYDLLCCFFCLSALRFYLRVRTSCAVTGRSIALWSALYVIALNCKEMAVTLPVIIGLYELTFWPPKWSAAGVLGWLRLRGRIPAIGGVITAMFIFGRLYGPKSISGFDGYKIVFDWHVYLDRALHFWRLALYEPRWLTTTAGVWLVVALMLACIAIPRPVIRLGVLWLALGILPVAFIPARGLDAVYVPAIAAAMLVSVGCDAAFRFVLRRREPLGLSESAALFAIAVFVIATWHIHAGRFQLEQRRAEGDQIRQIAEQLRMSEVRFPRGSRVLFLNDPFQEQQWSSVFLLRLYSGDPSLEPERLDRLVREAAPDQIVTFDSVLSYENGALHRCDTTPYRYVSVRDIGSRVPSCD